MNNNVIRVRDVEGTPDQLTQFFKDNNCDLGQYLKGEPIIKPKLSLWYIASATFLFVILCAMLFINPNWGETVMRILEILMITSGICVILFFHLTSQDKGGLRIVALGVIFLGVIALHSVSLDAEGKRAINVIHKFIDKKLDISPE